MVSAAKKQADNDAPRRPRLLFDPAAKRQPTRVQMVLEHVKDQIIAGQLKPGSQLPTENEIAEHLGISRTPVREAIKIFEAMGVLEVRIGSGTFVNRDIEPSLAQLLLFQLYLRKTTPQKMMEVRQMIARGCSEMAAQRRTNDDLAAMRSAIEKMEILAASPSPSYDEALEVDLEFHRAINRATHNELVETIGNFILDTVAPWIKLSLQRLSPAAAVNVHKLEYEMIAAGDSAGAWQGKTTAAVDISLENWRNSLVETPIVPKPR
ncbi:MAG: FadR family transcriptional regulator [Tagaea sp.]|nr:FadR family transcriptional regulator [Tagaea sp.]